MLMECSHGDQAPPTVDATYINKGRNLILELRAQDLLSQLERKSVNEILFLPTLIPRLPNFFAQSNSVRKLKAGEWSLGTRLHVVSTCVDN